MQYPKILDLEPNSLDSMLNTKYEFFGVSEHCGSQSGFGHYIAHTYRDGAYYLFDDEHHEKVHENQALDREAYLLFYR